MASPLSTHITINAKDNASVVFRQVAREAEGLCQRMDSLCKSAGSAFK